MNQFVANYLEIQEHNLKYERNEVTYLKEVNQFTDLVSIYLLANTITSI